MFILRYFRNLKFNGFSILTRIFLFSWTSSGIFLSFFREHCAHQNAPLCLFFMLCVQGTWTGIVHMFVLLPPFHSTCPGDFFLRVLIRCLFGHFRVWSIILWTSWQGRWILLRSFLPFWDASYIDIKNM
jgi:hypothetical protein